MASGRAADVFDLGDGTVLRRYRGGVHDVEYERRVMRYVAEHGIPVPTLGELASEYDPATDIVMERIDGPTMLEDLEAHPWRFRSHIRLLASLQRRINAVPAPDWMLAAGSAADSGAVVLHVDLHPMNVLLSPRGPVVIDWTNASAGPGGFDAAMTYVLMATYEVESTRDRLVQRLVGGIFRRARGARLVDAYLGVACDHRLADPGVTPGERVRVAALRKVARS